LPTKHGQDCGQEAGVGRNEMGAVLEYGISSGLISLTSSRPGHTGMPMYIAPWGGAPENPLSRGTPLVRASALHGVSGQFEPEATWAQPLSREELS